MLLPFTLLSFSISACANNSPGSVSLPASESRSILAYSQSNSPSAPAINKVMPENSELPIIGATGYASVAIELKPTPDSQTTAEVTLAPGTGFTIKEEQNEWWYIESDTAAGWTLSKYCLINLPDIIPFIIYDNTNTYNSLFLSSNKAIPNITGQALYSSKSFNARINKEEYIMPVLYPMAAKIHRAQQQALQAGDSLKIYEAYRPFAAQQKVVQELTTMANQDPEIMAGINTAPWNMNWFIATSVSNHQVGYAIDVSLVKITEKTEKNISGYIVTEIQAHTEYEMPTRIHELSFSAATFTGPVAARTDAWKTATLAPTMNEPAIKLQNYCTNAGLSPLASEWWHFNDIDALHQLGETTGVGDYVLTQVYSELPPA